MYYTIDDIKNIKITKLKVIVKNFCDKFENVTWKNTFLVNLL